MTPQNNVVPLCIETIRPMGGEYAPTDTCTRRKAHTSGRRESRRPLYALRPQVDGKQVYALSRRGYVVKVKHAETAPQAAQA